MTYLIPTINNIGLLQTQLNGPYRAQFLSASGGTLDGPLTVDAGTAMGTLYGVTVNFDGRSVNGMAVKNIAEAGTGVAVAFLWGASTVGSISLGASSVAYNTTSDETFKIRRGYLAATEAARIIRADPTWDFTWKADGSQAYGWGAQTSHAVRPDLGSPGGWYDAEGASCEETDDGATYRPWGVDQGKRTPYLWAAIGAEGGVLDRLEALESALTSLAADFTAYKAAHP